MNKLLANQRWYQVLPACQAEYEHDTTHASSIMFPTFVVLTMIFASKLFCLERLW